MPTNQNSGDGEYKLWIDETLVFSAYNIDRDNDGTADYFTSLNFYPSSEAGEAFEHWIDEMVIYEGYIPPSSQPTCPDGICDGTEDCQNCAADCGNCCGDGDCNPAHGENCSTCSADCGACSIDCVHEADLPVCDGCVDTNELSDYIGLWKSGSVDITDLMSVIGLWKTGCQ